MLFIVYAQYILSTIDNHQSIILYNGTHTNQQFNNNYQTYCNPNCQFIEQQHQDSRIFEVINTNQKQLKIFHTALSLNEIAVSLQGTTSLVEQELIIIQPNSNYQFELQYTCFKQWAYIQLHIIVLIEGHDNDVQQFEYIKYCDNIPVNNYPDIILRIVGCILVCAGAVYGQKQFRFRGHREVEIDELESRENFYRVQQCSSLSADKQPQPTAHSFVDEISETHRLNQDIPVKRKIIIYCMVVTAINLGLIGQLDYHTVLVGIVQFICLHFTITDILSYIISSKFYPEVRLPLYNKVRCVNLMSLVIVILLMWRYYQQDSWYMDNILIIVITLQFIRIFYFRNLKQITIVYSIIIIGLLLSNLIWSYNLNQQLLLIQFPNTLGLNNPKLTCSQFNMLIIILPAKLLQFVIRFQRQHKYNDHLMIYGVIGYTLSQIICELQQYLEQSQFNEIFISTAATYLFVIVAELANRNIDIMFHQGLYTYPSEQEAIRVVGLNELTISRTI